MVDPGAAPQPEVKVLTFITMRSFVPRRMGEDAYASMRAGLSPETLASFDLEDPGEWVPEAHMHEVMRWVYDQMLESDDDAYLEFARDLAKAGISRFLRIFLSLASERFVLSKIPTVWKRLRRNAGQVSSEHADGIIRLSYDGFPFFGDRVYRLLSLANCEALVFAATKRLPLGAVKHWSKSSMILEFELRA